MKFQNFLARFLLTILVVASAMPGAAVADSTAASGTIVGLVTNAAKAPVAHATVTAVRTDGGSIRATLSGSDGIYSFADLPPGVWRLTVQVEGYPEVSTPPVQVVAAKASRQDLVLNVPASSPGVEVAAAKPATQDSQAIPLALSKPDAVDGVDNDTPFAYGDFTWLNGSPRNKEPVFDTKFFTPDIRFDAHYMQDFNNPSDHTIVGSTESFRSGEFQLEQVSLGGDFHYDNVRARFLSLMGLFSTTTPRNDASPSVGQWDLGNAYRYLSEANAGYHFDVAHGLNVDAGIFVSYIGLFSYYNYDNWTYQPSYVSSNTPWFFNGLRIQYFPTNTLKIEPWLINGWQSYARFNNHLGFGGQILWQPHEWLKLVFNNYGLGEDNVAGPLSQAPSQRTQRFHTDDSIEVRYFNKPENGRGITKAAFSFTVDAGCQSGGGEHCSHGPNKSAFLGWMMYNRVWFDKDQFAVTLGGGAMNNPSRYLVLLPPINGATAATGSPYFPEVPGTSAYQWDMTLNLQYMPKNWITWWTEFGYRHSNIPYFAGSGGVTPPGGNNGSPGSYACNNGASSGTSDPNQAAAICGSQGSSVWSPDLRTQQAVWSAGVLVKF